MRRCDAGPAARKAGLKFIARRSLLKVCLLVGAIWQAEASLSPMPGQPSALSKISRWFKAEELPPPQFRFGVASASYQIEGGAAEGGRAPSIWDTFSHTPGKTHNGDTGDVACDFYTMYKQDIAMMKCLGVQMFRFSISWSRILPQGRGEANQAGLDFYSRVIDELLAADIEPHITLYHWDLPQTLEDDYGGWLDERIVPDFVAYAEVCFRAFGSRVTHWTTFNEPWSFVFLGFDLGIHAPVKSFRQIVNGGKISINLNSDWAEPMTSSKQDKEAAQRHIDFSLGIYADPIFKGDYPASVRERVAALPKFTPEEKEQLLNSVDYFALNHYTSKYVANSSEPFSVEGTEVSSERGGVPIGPQADSEWLQVVPWGFGKLLRYVSERYGRPDIYVTESGVDVPRESSLPLEKALKDEFRVKYYKQYLREALKAESKSGVRIKGYFAWSILDNFEWADGYAKRFGIVYVDYSNGLKRHVKDSAKWLAEYFAAGRQRL